MASLRSFVRSRRLIRASFAASAALSLVAAACGSSNDDHVATGGGGSASTSTASSPSASTATGATTAGSTSASAGTGQGGAPGAPTAAELLALTAQCNQVSNGLYASDDGEAPNIPICGLNGAVFWTADMDVDCDGKTTSQCNLGTDPAYQPETSATDSNGDPLDAAGLPYVVVPLPSSRFDYMAAGIQLGQVVAVVYDGQVAYGVFGDEGPNDIIGEASYAMASLLGVDPDPSTGGTDGPVTYIVFTNPSAVASPIEDHAAAVTIGEAAATDLLSAN